MEFASRVYDWCFVGVEVGRLCAMPPCKEGPFADSHVCGPKSMAVSYPNIDKQWFLDGATRTVEGGPTSVQFCTFIQ